MAGLTACYYLLKNDTTCHVTLFERDRTHLGGNINTRTGPPTIDMGTCHVFSWYHCVRALMKELHCPWPTQSLVSGAYTTATTTQPVNRNPDSPCRAAWTWLHLLHQYQVYMLSAVSPTQKGVTLQQFVNTHMFASAHKRAMFVAYWYGYAFGPIDQTWMGTLGGVLTRNSTVYSLHNNTADVVTTLLHHLQRSGRFQLLPGYTLINVTTQSHSVELHTGDNQIVRHACHAVVVATPCTPLVTRLLAAVTQRPLTLVAYTHAWVVLVRMRESTATLKVMGVVEPVPGPLVLVSYATTPLPNTLLLYVQQPDDDVAQNIKTVWAFLQQRCSQVHALTSFTLLECLDTRYFPFCMPFGPTHMDHINAVRAVPSASFIQFAGQWCGCPCLETACYSGRRAAAVLTGGTLALDLALWGWDIKHTGAPLYHPKSILAGLGILLFIILIAVVLYVIVK